MITPIRIAIFLLAFSSALVAQTAFNYSIELVPVPVTGMPGLHSFAFGQFDGKWLFIGGRRDGIHARQPFAAFPQASNNTEIFVVDIRERQLWSTSVQSLPVPLKEQLQSSNMEFYQDGEVLYLIGGYAFSASTGNHITYPKLTAVRVSELINAVINNQNIAPFFTQITHDNFAVTGGQLGKIGDTFYLVGGHRFDGRYNPMGPDHGPGFSQEYTNQIRKFNIVFSNGQLQFTNFQAITDPVHLHRRDYNLVPQIFPDGRQGYTISSGVFQIQTDLPFLYPVDITEQGYTPVTSFTQYLSNYHSARVAIYDSLQNQMHSLFFGGISQYYYQNGQLIQDNLVPFVNTISLVTRNADGTLQEFQLPEEMPGLRGASAEFILNTELPHYTNEVIKINLLSADTLKIGHIAGGINSTIRNPFESNQTSLTTAGNTVYEVRLIRRNSTAASNIPQPKPFSFTIFPNPTAGEVQVEYELPQSGKVNYFLTTMDGKIIQRGGWDKQSAGSNRQSLVVHPSFSTQPLTLTLVFDDKYYAVQQLFRR